jgi:hypothetical protein
LATLPSPWWYNVDVTEIETLEARVDSIRATGDPDLAARAYHALSKVLVAFTREKKKIDRFPIIKRVTARDMEWFLQDLAATRSRK